MILIYLEGNPIYKTQMLGLFQGFELVEEPGLREEIAGRGTLVIMI